MNASYFRALIIARHVCKYGIGQLLICMECMDTTQPSAADDTMYTIVMTLGLDTPLHIPSPTKLLTSDFHLGHASHTSLINHNFKQISHIN